VRKARCLLRDENYLRVGVLFYRSTLYSPLLDQGARAGAAEMNIALGTPISRPDKAERYDLMIWSWSQLVVVPLLFFHRRAMSVVVLRPPLSLTSAWGEYKVVLYLPRYSCFWTRVYNGSMPAMPHHDRSRCEIS
jgi:hypothetical protein